MGRSDDDDELKQFLASLTQESSSGSSTLKNNLISVTTNPSSTLSTITTTTKTVIDQKSLQDSNSIPNKWIKSPTRHNQNDKNHTQVNTVSTSLESDSDDDIKSSITHSSNVIDATPEERKTMNESSLHGIGRDSQVTLLNPLISKNEIEMRDDENIADNDIPISSDVVEVNKQGIVIEKSSVSKSIQSLRDTTSEVNKDNSHEEETIKLFTQSTLKGKILLIMKKKSKYILHIPSFFFFFLVIFFFFFYLFFFFI